MCALALEASSPSQALEVTESVPCGGSTPVESTEDRTTPAPGGWAARGQNHSEPVQAVKSALVPWEKDRKGDGDKKHVLSVYQRSIKSSFLWLKAE